MPKQRFLGPYGILGMLGVLGILAVPAFLTGIAFDVYWLRLLVKPWPVLALTAAVWFHGRRPYGRSIALGLLLSAAGDVLLEYSPATFLFGVGAFLFAHLAYLVGFVGEAPQLRLTRALPFLLWGVAVIWWLRPGLEAAGMLIPVALYTATICSMLWRAAARLGDCTSSSLLAGAGALLFAASDTLIAYQRFGGEGAEGGFSGLRYVIILLYWLGQVGLALSTRPESPP